MPVRVYKANNQVVLEYDPGETITVPLQNAYSADTDGTYNSVDRIKIIANGSPTAPEGNEFANKLTWYTIRDRNGATAATGAVSTVDYLNDIFDDPIEITDFVKADTSVGKAETTQFVHNGDITNGGALILSTQGAKLGWADDTFLELTENSVGGNTYGKLVIKLDNGSTPGNVIEIVQGDVVSYPNIDINGQVDFTQDVSFEGDVDLGNAGSDTITVNGTLVGVNIPDMDDVTVTTVSDKQILEYDSATSQWVNTYLDHSYVRVYNNSGAAMSKGDVVYISGSQNANVAQVGLAQANSSSTMPAIGVLYDDIANAAEGLAVVNGKANGVALPSASFSEGDVVYVSSTTAGGVTATKPTGTNLIQNLGVVMQTHNTNGTIKVTGVGRTNDVPNIPNGQAWIGNASGVATPTTLSTVATSGDYNDLINTPSAGAANELDGEKIEFITRSTAYNNGAYEGKVMKFGTATLQSLKLYQYTSSGWSPTDANQTGKAEGLLGLALGTSESSDGLLLDGLISATAFTGFSAGDKLYVSETESAITNTVPTATGSIVRIVGYALGSGYVHFNPSDNFIELA